MATAVAPVRFAARHRFAAGRRRIVDAPRRLVEGNSRFSICVPPAHTRLPLDYVELSKGTVLDRACIYVPEGQTVVG
jgi:hypothetical protein